MHKFPRSLELNSRRLRLYQPIIECGSQSMCESACYATGWATTVLVTRYLMRFLSDISPFVVPSLPATSRIPALNQCNFCIFSLSVQNQIKGTTFGGKFKLSFLMWNRKCARFNLDAFG